MIIKRYLGNMKRRIFRNRESITNNIKKNEINLEWWNKKENLGDYLAEVIYKFMLERFSLQQNKKCSKTIHLLTIGSIIGMKQFNSVVWGSGIHRLCSVQSIIKRKRYVKYDIRAVRGPVTRFLLMSAGYECPEIYGDPGVLMPLIYKTDNYEKKHNISVIYHLSQADDKKRDGLNYINIQTTDYKKFIDEIVQSELIISSSLHGIILAEAYGVPAIFLNEKMDNEIIKFFDWYYSTGRYNVQIAKSMDEALNMKPMELPNLDEMRERLINTFPKDLWK